MISQEDLRFARWCVLTVSKGFTADHDGQVAACGLIERMDAALAQQAPVSAAGSGDDATREDALSAPSGSVDEPPLSQSAESPVTAILELINWTEGYREKDWYRAEFDVARYDGSWLVFLVVERTDNQGTAFAAGRDANILSAFRLAKEQLSRGFGNCSQCAEEWPCASLIKAEKPAPCPACRDPRTKTARSKPK